MKQVDFVTLPGDEIEVKLGFDDTPPQLQSYQIEKPARLVFDLPNTKNTLLSRYLNLGNGNARSLTVVDNQERTRVVVNLGELSGYATRVEGNSLILKIGKQELAALATAAVAPAPSVTTSVTTAPSTSSKSSVKATKIAKAKPRLPSLTCAAKNTLKAGELLLGVVKSLSLIHISEPTRPY